MTALLKAGFCKWCGVQFVLIVMMTAFWVLGNWKIHQIDVKLDLIQKTLEEENAKQR